MQEKPKPLGTPPNDDFLDRIRSIGRGERPVSDLFPHMPDDPGEGDGGARDALQGDLEALKARLNAPPSFFGTVLHADDVWGPNNERSVVLMNGGRLLRTLVDPGAGDIVPGMEVEYSAKTLLVLRPSSVGAFGPVGVVDRLVGTSTCETTIQGSTRLVLVGKQTDVKVGDRVVLDASLTVAVANLGPAYARFGLESVRDIDWSAVIGQQEAKDALIEAIELPYTAADLYAFHKLKPIKGALLIGPPGCGKTHLGRAAATAIRRLHNGKGAATSFQYINCSEILEPLVGVAEATIRSVFRVGSEHFREHGYPSILFFDEIDAIGRKRGSGKSNDATDSILTALLAEMDGLADANVIVLMATNRPGILDTALTRDKRLDRKIAVTRPTQDDVRAICELNLRQYRPAEGEGAVSLANAGSNALFDPGRVLYEIHRLSEKQQPETVTFTLANIANGAMAAALADKAASIAFHRDRTENTRTGITPADMLAAVERTHAENAQLSFDEDIEVLVENFADRVIEVRKIQHQGRM